MYNYLVMVNCRQSSTCGLSARQRFHCPLPSKEFIAYRGRGTTAVLVRHKPQSHRHDRRGSAVVPSFIAETSRKIVKTADLLSSSHRRGGATAVLVRHKPQLHRNARRGSAVVPSLIAVAPRKTVNIADVFKTSAVLPRVGPMSVGLPRHCHYSRGTAMTATAPP